ncbi:MAG: hypothetical protein U1F27_13435 [Turneriella sp.]
MFRYGLMSEAVVFAGMKQDLPPPTWQTAVGLLGTAFHDPGFALKLMRAMAAMPLVLLHYRNFPGRRDMARLAGWISHARKLGV